MNFSYQRAVGMMSSMGCKSANNRFFVVRLLIAAMKPDGLIDENYNPLANSGIDRAIQNTTAPPKVAKRIYEVLRKFSQNIDFLYDLGKKYAIHKMRKWFSEFLMSRKPPNKVESTNNSKSRNKI